jgi:hypothetical protein
MEDLQQFVSPLRRGFRFGLGVGLAAKDRFSSFRPMTFSTPCSDYAVTL